MSNNPHARVIKCQPSPFSSVYRYLVQVMQTDPLLSTQVEQWATWDGNQNSVRDFPQTCKVGLRLTPQGQNEVWADAVSLEGPLTLNVVMYVRSLNSDDIFDLWYLCQKAFFRPSEPADPITNLTPGQSIFAQLEAKGCLGAFLRFSQDVKVRGFEEAGTIVGLEGMAQMQIDIRTILNI